jgi:flavodoxin
MKAIIVYYTFTGHTQRAARLLESLLSCDHEEIELIVPYSGSDEEINAITQKQTENKETPEINKLTKDLSNYDTVILGTPVWWLDIPPAVRSFLNENHLSAKRVFAFITNGGNVGDSSGTIKEFVPSLDGSKILYLDFDDETIDLKVSIQRWISEIFQQQG